LAYSTKFQDSNLGLGFEVLIFDLGFFDEVLFLVSLSKFSSGISREVQVLTTSLVISPVPMEELWWA